MGTAAAWAEKLTSQRLLQPGEHLGAHTLLVSRPAGFRSSPRRPHLSRCCTAAA